MKSQLDLFEKNV